MKKIILPLLCLYSNAFSMEQPDEEKQMSRGDTYSSVELLVEKTPIMDDMSFTNLPPELLMKIFSYLSKTEDSDNDRSLLLIRQVSSSWGACINKIFDEKNRKKGYYPLREDGKERGSEVIHRGEGYAETRFYLAHTALRYTLPIMLKKFGKKKLDHLTHEDVMIMGKVCKGMSVLYPNSNGYKFVSILNNNISPLLGLHYYKNQTEKLKRSYRVLLEKCETAYSPRENIWQEGIPDWMIAALVHIEIEGIFSDKRVDIEDNFRDKSGIGKRLVQIGDNRQGEPYNFVHLLYHLFSNPDEHYKQGWKEYNEFYTTQVLVSIYRKIYSTIDFDCQEQIEPRKKVKMAKEILSIIRKIRTRHKDYKDKTVTEYCKKIIQTYKKGKECPPKKH